MLDGMLSKLHRNFLGTVEAETRDLEALLEGGPLTFELSESLTLGKTQAHEHPVWISLATRSLSAAQYQKIIGAVGTILDEAQSDEGEKRCTLAFLAYRGEGAL